jgi:spore germination protein (amino acid permease)
MFKNFPNSDILDISEFLGGKSLKITIGVAYIIYLMIIVSFLIRNFSESLRLIYFPNTHFSAIALIFIIVAIILNKLGFKTIVKCNLIILPLVLLSLLIIFFSTIDEFTIQRFFPILGNGFNSTFILGATNIFSFGGIILLYFIMPILNNSDSYKKVSFISIIISSVYLLLSVISLLLVIPMISSAESTLSIYLAAREVQFGDFFQRVDAIFILIWMLSIFSYFSVILSYILFIFKKIFNNKHSKPMVYCFAFLIFTLSLIPKNAVQINTMSDTLYKYLSLTLVFGISIFILILANLKKKKVNSID